MTSHCSWSGAVGLLSGARQYCRTSNWSWARAVGLFTGVGLYYWNSYWTWPGAVVCFSMRVHWSWVVIMGP